MTDLAAFALAGAAGLVGGAVNAIAGGGSLVTFPALVACGLPPLIANATNTVALCPGYLAASLTQRRALAGQRGRARAVLPVAAVGGASGALLVLATGEAAFAVVVPFLIAFAVVLLAIQPRAQAWVAGRVAARRREAWAALPVGLAAIYGAYFGAAMGVIVLAALAVVLDDDLARINALKQTVSLTVNVAAAIVFVASGRVAWGIAGAVACGALAGGAIGGAIGARVPAAVLRWTVVVFGSAVASYYFATL